MPDKKLEEIINRILQVIIPDKIILFGSRARGKAKPESDYDLLVIKSGIDDEIKIARKIYRNLIGVDESVDIMVEKPETLEKYKNSVGYIYKSALEEGIVVYGPV